MARRSSVSAIKFLASFPSENAFDGVCRLKKNLTVRSLFFLHRTIVAPFTNFETRQRLKKTQ
jgi:hypothetical protein